MKTAREHSASALFVLLLLGLFAVFSTVLVVMGAKCYQRLVNQSDALSQRRVLTSFVRSTVRIDDEDGIFSTEDDGSVLCVNYDFDGEKYTKRLYLYDGNLMESFTDAAKPFSPEQGETLCDANAFSVAIEGNLLTATVQTAEGEDVVVQTVIYTSEE